MAQFDIFFKSRIAELDRLRHRLAPEPNESVGSPWEDFTDIAGECAPLFSECLAFLAGSLVRDSGIDGGVGFLADSVLDYLAGQTAIPWSGITVLGDETQFIRVMEIIRLRFADLGLWGLPSVAHEFGHIVARKVKAPTILRDNVDSSPFGDLLDAQGGGSVDNYLAELFADVFAVHATGPAFLCRSVMLTFDPSKAYSHGLITHPMSAMRVELMRRAIRSLNAASAGAFDGILHTISALWEESLRAAGQPRALAEGVDRFQLEALDQWWSGITDIITNSLPTTARYATFRQAQQLWDELEVAAEKQDLYRTLAAPEADRSIVDVLNAVWLFRIHHPHGSDARLPELERTAQMWCSAIAARSRRTR